MVQYGSRPYEQAPPNGAKYQSLLGDDNNPGTLNSPVRTLQRAIQLAPDKGVVCVREGFYEEGNCSQLWNRALTVQNAPGEEVTFSGSTEVPDWNYIADGMWAKSIDLQFSTTPLSPTQCTAEHPEAAWPYLVLVDDIKLTQTPPYRAMQPGEFRYDSVNKRMFVKQDLTHSTVRIGTKQLWLSGTQNNQTGQHPTLNVHGFIIQDFCPSPQQFAALRVYGHGSAVTDNDFWNITAAATFMQLGDDMVLEHNGFVHCGQLGYHNYRATNLLILGNSIEYCNDRHNSHIAIAGGGKSDGCPGVTHKQNRCIYNEGHDLWADTGSHGAKWLRNVVISEHEAACLHGELSRDLIFAGNYTDGGAVGCLASSTANARVVNNTAVNTPIPFKWQKDDRSDYPQVNYIQLNNNIDTNPIAPVNPDIAELLELTPEQRMNPPRGWFGPDAQAQEEPPAMPNVLDDLNNWLAPVNAALQYIQELEGDYDECASELSTVRGELDTANANVASLQALNTDLSNQVTTLEAELAACMADEDPPDPEPVGLEPRLTPLRGQCRYGWSAKPGTLAAYQNVQNIIGTDAPGKSRRIFATGDLDWTVDTAAGRIPYVEVPIGSNYAAFADTAIADDKPVVFTIGHEEERPEKNNTAAWFLDNYEAAFDVLKWVPKAVIGTTWMNQTLRAQTANVNIQDWLPPTEKTHFLGADVYVGNPLNQPFNSHENVLKPMLMVAADLGVPLMIAEFGVGGPMVERAAYVVGVMQWIKGLLNGSITYADIPNAGLYAPLIIEWFNSNIGGSPPMTFDGTKGWEINKAADQVDTQTPGVWKYGILTNGI